jgi:hypothetical protein
MTFVVTDEDLGPLGIGELAAAGRYGGELGEVGGAVGPGSEEHQHGGRGSGGVGEAVDAARRDVEHVAGEGVQPAGAVVEPDGPGQDVERLVVGAVKVRARTAGIRAHVPPVEAELAAGVGGRGQVVSGGAFGRAVTGGLAGRPESSGGLAGVAVVSEALANHRLVLLVLSWSIGDEAGASGLVRAAAEAIGT